MTAQYKPICAVCGLPITDSSLESIDHIFPKAIGLWAKSSRGLVTCLLTNPANKATTHKRCNHRKQDRLPSIEALRVSEEQKIQLRWLSSHLAPYVKAYAATKERLYHKQSGRCFGCNRPIKQSRAVLRRIDPWGPYAESNGCVVCQSCNNRKGDFLAQQVILLKAKQSEK